jgi:hypothetical protein
LIFGESLQRRGTHVSTPKNGSRGDGNCFGGILGFCAELRREFFWGNLGLMFFGGFGSGPRGGWEEGGHYVFSRVFGGTFWARGRLVLKVRNVVTW